MSNTSEIAASLRAHLTELTANIARIETALQAPLDADFSEQAAELENRDPLAGIEEAHRIEINQIHAALSRIDAGTYGQCSVCGAEIPTARLKAMPTATTCVTHAKT